MKKRRVIVIVMSLVMIMSFSVTSLAAYKTKDNGTYFGSVSTSGTNVSANTKDKNGSGPTYVSIRAKYETSSGGTYWSSKTGKSSTGNYVNYIKSYEGTVIAAETGHGMNSNNVEFLIQVP